MQSEPVSPPPMTTTCLPAASIFGAGAECLAGHAAVLLRQEVHGEVNAAEIAAGHRDVARLFRAARQQNGVVFLFDVGELVGARRRGRCNGRSRLQLPSA